MIVTYTTLTVSLVITFLFSSSKDMVISAMFTVSKEPSTNWTVLFRPFIMYSIPLPPVLGVHDFEDPVREFVASSPGLLLVVMISRSLLSCLLKSISVGFSQISEITSQNIMINAIDRPNIESSRQFTNERSVNWKVTRKKFVFVGQHSQSGKKTSQT